MLRLFVLMVSLASAFVAGALTVMVLSIARSTQTRYGRRDASDEAGA